MSSLPVARHYASRYPLPGMVAILCEGDLAGYEAELLARVSASFGYADIWPCGTKRAIFGMTDALGRAIPVLAIEDRDFRTPESALAECKDKLRDRVEKRGVRMHAWRAWRRNEIENYLVDPAVIAPAFALAFDVQEQEVLSRLENLLPFLVIDQAALWSIAQFRDVLPDRDRYVPGLPRDRARPRWADTDLTLIAPDQPTVRTELANVLTNKYQAFCKKNARLEVDALIGNFDKKCLEWAIPGPGSQAWRIDWSGKEVLAWLRRWFASDPGWCPNHGATRERVTWQQLPKPDSQAVDRAIEYALQPYLVRSFIQHLAAEPSGEIAVEWSELESSIKTAMQAPA